MRGLRIGAIVEIQQPEIHKKLNNNEIKKRRDKKEENLSFSDILELMSARSYKRHRGALRQRQ